MACNGTVLSIVCVALAIIHNFTHERHLQRRRKEFKSIYTVDTQVTSQVSEQELLDVTGIVADMMADDGTDDGLLDLSDIHALDVSRLVMEVMDSDDDVNYDVIESDILEESIDNDTCS